mgnify:FL=1
MERNKFQLYAVMAVALVLAVIGVVRAQSSQEGEGCVTVNGVEFCNSSPNLGGASFISSGTNLTDLQVENDLLVMGDSDCGLR